MAIGTHGTESGVIVVEGIELVVGTAECASCNVIFLLCRILLSGPETPLELSANRDEASLGDIIKWVVSGLVAGVIVSSPAAFPGALMLTAEILTPHVNRSSHPKTYQKVTFQRLIILQRQS